MALVPSIGIILLPQMWQSAGVVSVFPPLEILQGAPVERQSPPMLNRRPPSSFAVAPQRRHRIARIPI